MGAKKVLWESSKNQFGRPKKKKKVVKIFEFFLKIRPPPPRENPRSAPGYKHFRWKCLTLDFSKKICLELFDKQFFIDKIIQFFLKKYVFLKNCMGIVLLAFFIEI